MTCWPDARATYVWKSASEHSGAGMSRLVSRHASVYARSAGRELGAFIQSPAATVAPIRSHGTLMVKPFRTTVHPESGCRPWSMFLKHCLQPAGDHGST